MSGPITPTRLAKAREMDRDLGNDAAPMPSPPSHHVAESPVPPPANLTMGDLSQGVKCPVEWLDDSTLATILLLLCSQPDVSSAADHTERPKLQRQASSLMQVKAHSFFIVATGLADITLK